MGEKPTGWIGLPIAHFSLSWCKLRKPVASFKLASGFAAAILFVVAAVSVHADNHDESDLGSSESQTIPEENLESGPSSDTDQSSPTTADARIISFLSRLQTLEREYSALQGRVDELEHFYQEERHLNRKRFLDLDRRLRELSGGKLAPADALSSSESANTEVGIYRRAMSLIDDMKYEDAKNLFTELMSTYPNGDRVPNAMFWLGELNYTIEPKDLEKSRQFFVQMVTLYSDHARIPDALTKLGMIYHELGNTERAIEYFGRVMSEFPDHDAARIAETYENNLR